MSTTADRLKLIDAARIMLAYGDSLKGTFYMGALDLGGFQKSPYIAVSVDSVEGMAEEERHTKDFETGEEMALDIINTIDDLYEEDSFRETTEHILSLADKDYRVEHEKNNKERHSRYVRFCASGRKIIGRRLRELLRRLGED